MPCITQQTPIDPKEQRRQRDRERYAKMDKSKKDEINRKRREAIIERKLLQTFVSKTLKQLNPDLIQTSFEEMENLFKRGKMWIMLEIMNG